MITRKKIGIVRFIFTGYTPLWIDAINAKTGAEATIYLNNKMSDKFKETLNRQIEESSSHWLTVSKMEDEGCYKFIRFAGVSRIARQKLAEKKIAYEALEREAAVGYNPARSRANRQSLVLGRAGLPTFERTGNKVSRVLNQSVDRSEEFAEAKAKKEEAKQNGAKKKFLEKLRKKYFYDREFFPNITDTEWDAYLLETYGEGTELNIKDDSEFKQRLREAGL